MAMIIKRRARKALENVKHSSVGYAPNGIGGITDENGKASIPCMSIHVGEHRILMTIEEFLSIHVSLARTMRGE